MKKLKPDTSILTASFWAGLILLGILPPAGGAAVRYFVPAWEASPLWRDLTLLFVILAALTLIVISLIWSFRQKYQGLYALGSVVLLAQGMSILLFGAAEKLMESPPFFVFLPNPGGLALALMLGAWAGLYKAHNPKSSRDVSGWKWVLTLSALIPLGVAYFLREQQVSRIIYCLIIMVPQTVMLIWLSHRTPEDIRFLRAVVLAGLISDFLGFFLLTPYGEALPGTAGILTQIAGPWIFLYGMKRKSGGGV